MNGKKIITFVLGSMGGGGAERVVSIIANHFADYGYHVHIITLLDDLCAYELNSEVQLRTMALKNDSRIKHFPKWIKDIRDYVKKENPHVMVAFSARISFTVFIACVGLGIPIVVSERSDPAKDGRSVFVKWGTYFFYRYAKVIVFQTKWAMSCFPKSIQKLGVIIYNPIVVSKHATKVKDKKIVTAGRLSVEKNHKLLINAFKHIHEKYPEYKLHIFGEGHLEDDLKQLIIKLELNDTVLLRGRMENLHAEISDAEIFVLSSDYEGLPNALLEAMMMGLPCISTNCAGSNEVIVEGNNGLIVPVGSEIKLAEAIDRLIVDKELAKSIGENAKITSKAFEKEDIFNKWREVID